MEKIILTGDRPTGKLHLGHYIGSLRRRVELQNKGDFSKMFVFMADVQALTDNADNPEKIRQNIIEVALDYLAAGLDPERCTLFIQSQIPELAELTTYLMNLITVSRVQRNPTVKTEIKMRNFEANIPLGFFCYPVSQAADITLFKATTVPAGEDQEPMLEVTRELVRRFNQTYAPVLVEPEIMLPENATARRLPGTDGKEKMSKSLGNCIYLSDSEKEVWKKVKKMSNGAPRMSMDEPGNLEGNAVFTYLEAFSCDDDFANYWPEFKNSRSTMSTEVLATAHAKSSSTPSSIICSNQCASVATNWSRIFLRYTISCVREQRRLARQLPRLWLRYVRQCALTTSTMPNSSAVRQSDSRIYKAIVLTVSE